MGWSTDSEFQATGRLNGFETDQPSGTGGTAEGTYSVSCPAGPDIGAIMSNGKRTLAPERALIDIHWMTYEDAAEILGKSVPTISRYVADGKLISNNGGHFGKRVREDAVAQLKMQELREALEVSRRVRRKIKSLLKKASEVLEELKASGDDEYLPHIDRRKAGLNHPVIAGERPTQDEISRVVKQAEEGHGLLPEDLRKLPSSPAAAALNAHEKWLVKRAPAYIHGDRPTDRFLRLQKYIEQIEVQLISLWPPTEVMSVRSELLGFVERSQERRGGPKARVQRLSLALSELTKKIDEAIHI